MLRKAVHKGYDGAAALHQSPAKVHVGDVGKLIVRDIQQPGQLDPVRGRLVQHDQKLAVGQHRPGRMGLQQIVG